VHNGRAEEWGIVLRTANVLLAAASVAAWVASASAQTPVSDSDATLFGARESAVGLDISPNGKFVSYVAPARGGGAVGFVADVQTGETKAFINSGGGPEQLRWCYFVTDSRLVCRYTAIVKDAGIPIGFSRLIAVNSDGSNLKQLGQKSTFYDAGIRQYDGSILDWLPGGGGSVLMAREYMPESGTTGTRITRTKNGFGVDRIDTETLSLTPVEPPNREAGGYMSDGQGHVRLMEFPGVEHDLLTGKSKYYYRTVGSRSWKSLTDYVDDDDFQPLAIDATSDSLYVLKPLDGRKALYRIKLTDSPTTELVASHPRVDIDDVIRSASGQNVIGYSFAVEKRDAEYFDPEYKSLVSALGKAIPNLPLIRFARASADGTKMLIFAGSDNDPGRYFVFDKKTKNLAEIMLVRPELENRKLANVLPVTVKAPDGTSIPAYLTTPPGKGGKNLPAIVLPHGGPSSRDEWGFDWLAQYLAARGYAVLQPNYRGSAGFGDSWLMQNGFKSWRTSIGDIIASARWLATQGFADPNRIAVVGWSYGGYAALQAAATEPSLFKAVAAIAPVTDLGMLKEEAKDFTNSQVVADFVGAGPHVRDGSPLRHAAEIKVPVLLVHGDMDLNVAVEQSDKMDGALQASGGHVEYLRYKGLDHQLEDSAARTEVLTKIGQLLDRTIGH
jgi:dipeptidyl aminopeptidase/acylaminoacyl peptidase